MLAWLNMGIIPPHLRVVTYKVATRGGEYGRIGGLAENAGPPARRFFGDFPNIFGGSIQDMGEPDPYF